MKSTSGWNNGNGTNSSNFSALPGGVRATDAPFFFIGFNGYWWSSTGYNSTDAWYRILDFNNNVSSLNLTKGTGFSVRCIKN
jgi:uncharacterized protein (TIGR02145 family)